MQFRSEGRFTPALAPSRLRGMSALLALAVAVGGLHGVVVRGPTRPVCMVGMPCSAPVAGAVLAFARDGRVAARVRTDGRGRYSVRLGSGVYAVLVTPQPRIGTGIQPRTVRVRAGIDALQSFVVDTGIR